MEKRKWRLLFRVSGVHSYKVVATMRIGLASIGSWFSRKTTLQF